jgi:uncharacterized protein with WD repeat
MSDTASVEVIEEQEIPNPSGKKHGNAGRKVNDAQLASLRKGMEALKTRREAISKAKAEGTYSPEAFAPKAKVVTVPRPKPEVVYVERKERVKKAKPMAEEFAEIRNTLSALSAARAPVEPKEVVKEVIKEVPVERVVEREVIRDRVVSGRELLDKIFFSK